MSADEITCREFVELVTDFFEGALDEPTTEVAEEHLVMCDWCETYAEQVRTTIALLRELRIDGAAPEPSASVLAALRARRTDAQ